LASEPIHVLELRSVRGTGGGPEKTIMLGAAQTDPRDFRVTVCYIRDGRDQTFRLDERAAALGIDYVEVHERHSFDLAVWPSLRRLVRDRGVDIVHAHEYKSDLLALALAQSDGVIPLATVHGWTGQSRRELGCYYPCDRRLLARYPRLIAVSTQIKAQLAKSGTRPDRVTVVLNGIDARRFTRRKERERAARAALGYDSHHRVIGAVGRLERQKRFDVLIKAVAILHRSHPEVRLVIAGDGSLKGMLTDLAANLLPPGVSQFLGNTDDVSAVHHALDVFVQSSEYEGTPNAVLEAMAYETPIVATDAGGTAEIALDGVHALIVKSVCPEGLASAIAVTLSESRAACLRTRAARQRVEADLSFHQRMRRVEAIYKELISGPRAAQRTGFLRWV
jgi:glycosyltransferase involved in cell wall biosynthesis